MTKDNSYIGVILEDIQSKLKGVAENVTILKNKADKTDQRLTKIEDNTNLIPAIQLAVKAQTSHLKDHEVRISELEAV